ncbi:DUF3572 domain-containing protein [Shimia marina]|uniref:DUF3572 domain-containing protein n=1 Tax=Shimia marina TaxID=321267 RepID=A0A0P1FGR4_9RHOB|nr:DUF3572 domain-containing protein [Shimia marina]CUH53219.1 hypothetical protein SHM7688_02671 [Shimia marina]SFD82189.1 Protein of unknown function [Shimia marina]
MNMSQDFAETVALKALGWLVTQDEVVSVFLGATGASVEDLRVRAGDSDFMGSVLEFLTMDDAWVVAFCDANELAFEVPLQAAHQLLGASRAHWT